MLRKFLLAVFTDILGWVNKSKILNFLRNDIKTITSLGKKDNLERRKDINATFARRW